MVYFDKKIFILKNQIILNFEKRTNLIPSLFEITKDYINMHDDVFKNVLKIRKNTIFLNNNLFIEKVHYEILIHSELNFIFKILTHHPKIQKNEKFLMIKDLFIENSQKIWDKVVIYKKVIKTFNFLLNFSAFTISWLFFDLEKKKIFKKSKFNLDFLFSFTSYYTIIRMAIYW